MIPHFDIFDISLGIYIATLTKAKDWEYENEWRIINNTGTLFQPVPKPTAIYLGTCFNKNEATLQNELLGLATSLNIPVSKMKIHHSKFTIEPLQLE